MHTLDWETWNFVFWRTGQGAPSLRGTQGLTLTPRHFADTESPAETEQSIQATLHNTTNEFKWLCEKNKTKPQIQPKPFYHSQDSLAALCTLKSSSHSPSSSSLCSSKRIINKLSSGKFSFPPLRLPLADAFPLLADSHITPCPSQQAHSGFGFSSCWIQVSRWMNSSTAKCLSQPPPLEVDFISLQGGMELWTFNVNPAFSPRLMCVSGFHHSHFNLLLHIFFIWNCSFSTSFFCSCLLHFLPSISLLFPNAVSPFFFFFLHYLWRSVTESLPALCAHANRTK